MAKEKTNPVHTVVLKPNEISKDISFDVWETDVNEVRIQLNPKYDKTKIEVTKRIFEGDIITQISWNGKDLKNKSIATQSVRNQYSKAYDFLLNWKYARNENIGKK